MGVAGFKKDQLRRVSNSAAMPLSSSSRSSLSMLERNSSFTSSPMPSSDSFSFLSSSSSLAGTERTILLGQYSSGAGSWLLMSWTMGWCLGRLEVVLLGKQEPLLRPRELVTELLVLVFDGQLWKVLCSKSSPEPLFMERPSVCPPKEVLYLRGRSSGEKRLLMLAGRLSLLGKLRNILGASLTFSLDFSLERVRTALETSLFSLDWSLGRNLLLRALSASLFSSSKLREGRKSLGLGSLARDGGGRSRARALTASNLTRRSSRERAEARCRWSKRSQSLRKLVTLRTMASQPSVPAGRQILTLFSRTSGLIHTNASPRAPRNAMFSLRMKQPQRSASLTHATTTLLAIEKARSLELSSLSLGRGSPRRSSVQTSRRAPGSCLPTMTRGVPSMWLSSRWRKASRSRGERRGTRWQIRSFCLMIIYGSMEQDWEGVRSGCGWGRWPR